ncbi:hypothetical protein GCM10022279_05440 [Comamonas faecalis]|uniref:Uncharacterized protein n=1 Tax=Comamonas faecalis TaxID=1387849 RepID=A0ABP7QMQ2_9BURK
MAEDKSSKRKLPAAPKAAAAKDKVVSKPAPATPARAPVLRAPAAAAPPAAPPAAAPAQPKPAAAVKAPVVKAPTVKAPILGSSLPPVIPRPEEPVAPIHPEPPTPVPPTPPTVPKLNIPAVSIPPIPPIGPIPPIVPVPPVGPIKPIPIPPILVRPSAQGNLFSAGRAGAPVARADDLLALRVELVNLKISPGSPPTVVKQAKGSSQIVLHFPPQNIAEEVFYEKQPSEDEQNDQKQSKSHDQEQKYLDSLGKPTPTTGTDPGAQMPIPLRARIAGESRVVFEVPDGFSAPYTLQGVLEACMQLPLSVAANALAPQPAALAPPIVQLPLDQLLGVKTANTAARLALGALRTRLLATGTNAASVLAARGGLLAASAAQLGTPVQQLPHLPIPRPVLKPRPAAPAATQTAIELPWRLIVSPHRDERLQHAGAPVVSALTRRTELWHTRLVGPAVDGQTIEPPRPDAARTLRAVWALMGEGSDPAKPMRGTFPTTDDLPPSTTSGGPFLTTLSDFDRVQIAHSSSNFSEANYAPQTIDTHLLMLSALGGWLDSRGEWDPPGLPLEEWSHRAAMGRDHWVRVVYKGFLFPFGHRVALIKVSERKFHNGLAGNPAFVRQRMFIVIRERQRDYVDPQLVDPQGRSFARQMPFNQVRILTTVTPDLDKPTDGAARIGAQGQSMFWPCVGGKPFAFRCVGTDIDGRRVGFELPLIFMDSSRASPRKLVAGKLTPDYTAAQGHADTAQADWNARSEWRTAAFKGQRMALALSTRAGDTAVEAQYVSFGAQVRAKGNGLRDYSQGLQRPLFYPSVTRVEARIPALAQLTGASASNALTWNAHYLEKGFEDNVGEVFVDVDVADQDAGGAQLDFSSQGDRSGGFVMPNMAPRALSRMAGPVSVAPGKFVAGSNITGADLFPGGIGNLPLPLLFGCIPLGEVLKSIASVGGAPQKIPQFVSEASTKVEAFVGALVRAYEFLRDLGADSSALGKAALGVVQGLVDDQLAQAKGLPVSSVAQLQSALTDFQDALGVVWNQLDSVSAGTSVDAIGNALASLPDNADTVVDRIDHVVDVVRAAPLPSGLAQSVLAMAGQAKALLQDLKTLEQLIPQATALYQALADIVGDGAALEEALSKPEKLAEKLQAVKDSLQTVRSTLAKLYLLEGAPRKMILGALDDVSEVLSGAGDLLTFLQNLLGEELVVRFDWAPEITNWPSTGAPIFRANDPHGFKVVVVARVKKSGGTPKIEVVCGLKHFDLVLIGAAAFLELNFEKIEFNVDSGAKMNVDVRLTDIKFLGPLSFVETLRDLIPLDGFSDPPYLDISAQGIEAGFSLALPNVAVGVLSLTNLSLAAAVTVPFIGQPLAARFNFCTREQPFNLTVCMFGGGGFFGVTVDPKGVQILEAAFEFGASVSMNFGVASGGVHVMAGIYFRMEQDAASLTGYFRLGGYVSVLGLITASLELYLELRYEFESGKAVGMAQLTIEVEVFLFSTSVTVRCERKFAGSNGDPSLRDLLGLDPSLPLADELALIDTQAGQQTQYAWRDYCDAFA